MDQQKNLQVPFRNWKKQFFSPGKKRSPTRISHHPQGSFSGAGGTRGGWFWHFSGHLSHRKDTNQPLPLCWEDDIAFPGWGFDFGRFIRKLLSLKILTDKSCETCETYERCQKIQRRSSMLVNFATTNRAMEATCNILEPEYCRTKMPRNPATQRKWWVCINLAAKMRILVIGWESWFGLTTVKEGLNGWHPKSNDKESIFWLLINEINQTTNQPVAIFFP